MKKIELVYLIIFGLLILILAVAMLRLGPDLPSWITPFITLAILALAFHQMIKTNEQLELTRKRIFGEVYEKAKIKDLQFFIPAKEKYEITYHKLNPTTHNTDIGKNIEIPKGKKVELFMLFKIEETQRLKSFEIHFCGDLSKKPEIIGSKHGFTKKKIKELPVSEAIDWNNTYHLEYANSRKIPKGEPFILSLTVKGKETGEFPLKVWIYSEEAKEAFEGNLEVIVS